MGSGIPTHPPWVMAQVGCDQVSLVIVPLFPSYSLPPVGTQQWWHHKEANVVGNQYMYTGDLMALQECLSQSTLPWPALDRIVPPLSDHLAVWSVALASHPDEEYRQNINGLTKGVRTLVLKYEDHTCQSARRNHPSATSQQGVIQEYIEKECQLGSHRPISTR